MQNKKGEWGVMKKILSIMLCIIMCAGFVGCSSSSSSSDKGEYTILHGEYLESNETDDNGLVIKVKIKPSTTNKLTIDQNGYNVEDLIKNQGCDKYDKIDYWAVADMDNGKEEKVVSFTLDKNTIQGIKDGNIVANEIVNTYANDVYIHQSLK
jgi:hypothetical protein